MDNVWYCLNGMQGGKKLWKPLTFHPRLQNESCVHASVAIFSDRNNWRYAQSTFQHKGSCVTPGLVNRAFLNHPQTVTCLSVTESYHWGTKLGGTNHCRCLSHDSDSKSVQPRSHMKVWKWEVIFIWPHRDKQSLYWKRLERQFGFMLGDKWLFMQCPGPILRICGLTRSMCAFLPLMLVDGCRQWRAFSHLVVMAVSGLSVILTYQRQMLERWNIGITKSLLQQLSVDLHG